MSLKTRGRRASSSKINSERLRFLLKQKKLNITKLSERIGYDRTGVSKSISKGQMDNQMIEAIGKFLDVDPLVLIEGYKGTFINLSRYNTAQDENGNDLPPYSSYIYDQGKDKARDHFINWLFSVSEDIAAYTSDITIEDYIKHRKEDIYPPLYKEGLEVDELMRNTIIFISNELSQYAEKQGIKKEESNHA